MSIALMNGRPPRKQLSDQLDRLDGILDCLADALPEAVRDAVRDGTQAALAALLSDPAHLTALRSALDATAATVTPPVTAAPASPRKLWSERAQAFLDRCRAKLAGVVTKVRDVVAEVATAAAEVTRRVRAYAAAKWDALLAVVERLKAAGHWGRAGGVALAVGLVVALLALVNHPLAALLSGLGATATAFTVQAWVWVRTTARRLLG